MTTEGMPFIGSEKRQCSYSPVLKIILVFLLSVLVFGSIYRDHIGSTEHLAVDTYESPLSCSKPAIRKEWRTLSRSEQEQYLAAVHCLRTQPSKIGLAHSLYDDFPWVHSRNGNYCTPLLLRHPFLHSVPLISQVAHRTSDFLPWHRYLLHTYEIALKEKCNYGGHLTYVISYTNHEGCRVSLNCKRRYWDWGLDWNDIKDSPVLSDDRGFGGNGNKSDTKSVAYGHCVTDGPFARFIVLYYGRESQPHCLSRGFDVTESTRQNTARKLRPEALENLLDTGSFTMFSDRLESDAHDAIPITIRGDFYRVTAPNGEHFEPGFRILRVANIACRPSILSSSHSA